MKMRNAIGNVLAAFGALNILNFWAPRPLPTVGPSAFIVGGFFIALGLWVRAPRDGSGRIQWGRLAALVKPDSGRPEKIRGASAPADPLLAVRTLRLASENGGSLTVAQAAMKLDVGLDAAQAALDECASKGTAYIDVDDGTGVASYRFPEFLPRPEQSD